MSVYAYLAPLTIPKWLPHVQVLHTYMQPPAAQGYVSPCSLLTISEETFIRGLQHLSVARIGSHAFSKLITGKGMVLTDLDKSEFTRMGSEQEQNPGFARRKMASGQATNRLSYIMFLHFAYLSVRDEKSRS